MSELNEEDGTNAEEGVIEGFQMLTPQQAMILDQQHRMLDTRSATGDQLDAKAGSLLQAGGLVIALAGAVNLPGFVSQPSALGTLGIAIAFGAFAGMVVCAALAWAPSKYAIPGTSDWEEIFQDYLFLPVDGCLEQVLIDLISTTKIHETRNRAKSRYVAWATWLFAVQIVGVLVLALVP